MTSSPPGIRYRRLTQDEIGDLLVAYIVRARFVDVGWAYDEHGRPEAVLTWRSNAAEQLGMLSRELNRTRVRCQP